MIETIERMMGDLECGKLTRRQFAVSLATLAAGAFAAPGALAVSPGADRLPRCQPEPRHRAGS